MILGEHINLVVKIKARIRRTSAFIQKRDARGIQYAIFLKKIHPKNQFVLKKGECLVKKQTKAQIYNTSLGDFLLF